MVPVSLTLVMTMLMSLNLNYVEAVKLVRNIMSIVAIKC